MKNKNKTQSYSYNFSTNWDNPLSVDTNVTFKGVINQEIVSSSTNSVMNYGDKYTPTPFAYDVKKYEVPTWSYYRRVPGLVTYSGQGTPNVALLRELPEDIYTQAYNTAVNSVGDALRGNIDLSIDVAEWRTTWNMLSSAVRDLRNIRKNFLKKLPTRLSDRNIANRWLEYRYGWMPTLTTIHDVSKRFLDSSSPGIKVVGYGSAYTSGSVAEHFVVTGGNVPVTGSTSMYKQEYVRIEAIVRPNSTIQNVATWTSLNPVSIGWELLPYSFVVDWVYDVGGYLRSVESAYVYRSAIRSVGTSRLTINKSSTYCQPDSGTGALTSRASRTTFSRTKTTSLPVTRLTFSTSGLGFKKFLTSAALLRQLF